MTESCRRPVCAQSDCAGFECRTRNVIADADSLRSCLRARITRGLGLFADANNLRPCPVLGLFAVVEMPRLRTRIVSLSRKLRV